MFETRNVITVIDMLNSAGIKSWITGVWGIDALLGVRTRAHKDLDIIIQLDDAARLKNLLKKNGYSLKELWEENLFVEDKMGRTTATAYVMKDNIGQELDIHVFSFDKRGNGIPAWNDDRNFIFSRDDLSGSGTIDGVKVNCLSPDCQLRCHQGYRLPEYQLRDCANLRMKYGLNDRGRE